MQNIVVENPTQNIVSVGDYLEVINDQLSLTSNVNKTIISNLTLTTNINYTKTDLGNTTFLILKTNTSTTRTFTLPVTDFVVNDRLILVLDSTSPGLILLSIQEKSIGVNRGNSFELYFDGTNWIITSIPFPFNLNGNIQTSNLQLGYGNYTSGTEILNVGNSSGVLGNKSISLGNNTILNTSGIVSVGNNNFAESGAKDSVLLGNYTYARRHGGTKIRLNTYNDSLDVDNPSCNLEFLSWFGVSTNATIKEIFLKGSSPNVATLQEKNLISFKGEAIAYKSDYTGKSKWEFSGLVEKNSSGIASIVDTLNISQSIGVVGGNTLVLTIDTHPTNHYLRVRVTGNDSETWYWLVKAEFLDLRIG